MTDEAKNTIPRPDPARFSDYREYLRALIAHLKATRPHFSYRWFSRRAGFASPNFLKLVADGDRNLSAASVEKFARGLGLDAEETEVFELLIRLDQATDDAERNRLFARLRRGQSKARTLETDPYDLYSEWYPVVLRELVERVREATPAALASLLRPAISGARARRALAVLERLGLVERVPDGWRHTERDLGAGARISALAVRNFHRAMLGLAARALDQVPPAERHVSALTVALTRTQYQAVEARIDAFRRELLELLDAEATGPRTIHQIQFIVFPVSEAVE